MARRSICANTLFAAAILVAGTSAGTGDAFAAGQDAVGPRIESTASAEHRSSAATELVIRSLSMLGVNYKWGGNSPDTGLDCSGLVRFVYEETLGKVLPRRSVEMSREGESVDRHELKPGDLVFFNTLRRAFSHVGIYIGNNQFVHAPSRGKQVRVESLESSYWAKRFNGARRLLAEDTQRAPLAFERPRQSLPAEFRSGL
jgi:cell wall-associated NlpC family hydrolase